MMGETIHFVSLGDSIATGTLTPFSRTYSYVFYLRRMFREQGLPVTLYNLAHDGDTSRDLLWKLGHSQQFRKVIEKADLITVSIGGNDLMRAASIPGFASVNLHMAKTGTDNFVGNWPRIVERIRDINPEATVVVLSLYNPFSSVGQDRNLCETTDRFLLQINDTIAACSRGNYRIADIYTAFKSVSQGKMYGISCLYPNSLMRNPHPTSKAQKMIAELIFQQFALENLSGISQTAGKNAMFGV